LVHGLDLLRNPAVTLARAASNTFAGIRPADVGGFIAAQLVGAAAATALFAWLVPVRRGAQHDRPSVATTSTQTQEDIA
jgi:glycerol uptake facilitator-like aquaporin